MAFAAKPEAQKHFMILFDTAISPDNELLVACSTFGDIFIWNMSLILDEQIKKQNDTKCPLYDDHYDEDDDLNVNINEIEDAHDDNKSNCIIEAKEAMLHLPSFVFRPFPRKTFGAIYRLQTVKHLLFVATFDALYIYKWKDIITCVTMHTNTENTLFLNIKPIHKYIAPQIEYAHGAKSRYVEINAIAGSNPRDSVFLGTGNHSIFEVNLNKCTLMNTLNGHKDYVLDLSINNDYNLLSSSSNDGSVKVWNINNNNEIVASFNDDKHGYYANCAELHSNGRYLASGLSHFSGATKGRNKICLFELRMKSVITQLVVEDTCNCNYNYSPQVIRFSNAWRQSAQSNLSVVAGFNNNDLQLFDRDYTKSKLTMHASCAIQTSSKSIWSIKIAQNMAIVCGTSNKIDLIANTTNIVTSLSVNSVSA